MLPRLLITHWAKTSSGRPSDHARIGANAFVINRDVPPSATVVGTPARIVKLNGKRTDEELPRMASFPEAEAVSLEV